MGVSEGTTGRPRVLVLGAGVAALEVVLGLAELAPGRADVRLVAPNDVFVYRPLAVLAPFGGEPPERVPLARILDGSGARVHAGEVARVDPALRVAVTRAGERIPYDVLVVAVGAVPEEALPGALAFSGEQDEEAVRVLLRELESGAVRSVAFVVPAGPAWPLPLYELALMTAEHLAERGLDDRRLVLVTPAAAPLEQFGGTASRAVEELVESAGIELHRERYAEEVAGRELRLVPEGSIEVDRVVTLPRLRGPALEGLPADPEGFLRTDLHGRLLGVDGVFAAGNVTAFPVKHGGIAVQQAAAVADALAKHLGAAIEPAPFRPVLRGLLLTGREPRFLRIDLRGGRGETSVVALRSLWWPPGKIAGGRLARRLEQAGLPVAKLAAEVPSLQVELELPHPEPSAGSRARR